MPAGEPLAGWRGAESYRAVHCALAAALRMEGHAVRLSTGMEETGAAACFENPVGHDLVDGSNRKLAGAGQRRTKRGLLHQGSVALPCGLEGSRQRAESLRTVMALHGESCDFKPAVDAICRKVRERYALDAWTERRRVERGFV